MKIKLRNHFRYVDILGRNMSIEKDVKDVTFDDA